MKVPPLRFIGFSGAWDVKSLGDIASHISYGLTVRPEYINDGIPLISAREIKNGVIEYEAAPKISRKAFEGLSKNAIPKKGDIFLSKTGTIGLVAYFSSDLTIAITQNIAVIRVLAKDFSHQFILQLFRTKSFYKSAIDKVNQSTIMDLQLQDIRKLIVAFPPLPEQTKIANFLIAVDEKIAQLTQKADLLARYKKGAMQQIFSQQLRFKDDDGREFPEWDVIELEKIAAKINKKNKDLAINEVLTNSATQGVVSQSDYFDRDIANQNNLSGYYVVEIDDFVYNPRISAHALVGPIK